MEDQTEDRRAHTGSRLSWLQSSDKENDDDDDGDDGDDGDDVHGFQTSGCQ